MIFVLFELSLLSILAGLAILAPVLSFKLWGVVAVFLLAAFILPKFRALLVVCLLLLVGAAGPSLWLIVPGAMLLVLGCIGAVDDWREGRRWHPGRANWVLAGVVTLVACSLTALVARAALLFRSRMDLIPGAVDFLPTMLLLAGIWFGLDGHFRTLPGLGRRGVFGWFWERRHALGLFVASLIILFRVGFS